MNKKFGFTLAEVLIALTVVGIVSAMTVPTLMNKSTRKTQAALIHKAYVELSDAVELYMNDEDASKVSGPFADLDKVEHFLTHYYRVNKNCKSDPVGGGCLTATFSTISGSTGQKHSNGPYASPTNFKCIQDKAGITVCMCKNKGVHNAAQTTDDYHSADLIDVWFDTNGPENPNVKGRDIFRIYVNSNGDLVTWDESDEKYDKRETLFTSGCLTGSDPDGCIGKLLNDNWEMNY